MRGLLFTGGEQPDMAVALRLIRNHDFVIAADSGFDAAHSAGMVPDLVVGDMDSVDRKDILESMPRERVERWPADKDLTDTEIALAELERRGIREVTLVGGSGGRLDHLFAVINLFTRPFCPGAWIGRESVALAVGAGIRKQGVFVEGLAPDGPVSVFPVGQGRHECKGMGLHWPIDDLDWDGGTYSLSNRAEQGRFKLSVESGRFLVIVPLSPFVSWAAI